MLHQMKLKKAPFDKIKNGSKTIELRLNDEKRRKVQVGDFIEFSLLGDPEKKIQTRVTVLHYFTNFQELYAALPKEKLGYKPEDVPDPNHMDAYYSKEKQAQYGVVGIEIILDDFPKFVNFIKPKMILFDYGGTLLHEPDFSPLAGNAAIYPYISENPHKISLEEFSAYLLKLFDEIRAMRGELIEIHEHLFLRYVLEHFDMKLSIPIEEAEWIIWNGISKGCITPGADQMLALLQNKGIRTGVISNLCWSGTALTKRLKENFPEHCFDFIITSSEYIFRKPDSRVFDIAIRKSGLSAEEIWYCGNDVTVDLYGAHEAGLFPVFYDDRTVPSKIHEKNDSCSIDFPHLRIYSWNELTKYLDI